MNFIKQLITLDLTIDHNRKRIITFACLILFIPLINIMGIYHLISGSYLHGAVLIAFGLFLTINLIILKSSKRDLLVFKSILISTVIFFIYHVIIGGTVNSSSRILFLYILPLFAFMLGIREGIISNAILLVSISPFLVFQDFFFKFHTYQNDLVIRFFITFSVVSIISFFYEFVRLKYEIIMTNQQSKLKAEIEVRQRTEEILKESEEKYRLLVEHQKDLIFRFLPDSTLTFVNNSYCQFFGKTREQLIGIKWITFLPESSRVEMILLNESLAKNRDSYSFEYEVINAEGENRWYSFIITSIVTEKNTIEFQSIGRDITDNKIAEKALKDSEILFKSYMKHLPGIAFMKNDKGEYIYLSDVLEKIFRIKQIDWQGRTDKEIAFFSDEIVEQFIANDLKVLSEKKTLETIELVPFEDGVHYWLSIKFPILDNEGNLKTLAGISIDITKQKRTEEALKSSEIRIKTILDGIADTFFSLDRKWRFTMMNQAAEKAPFGKPASELLGKVIWEIYPSLLGTHIHQHYLNTAENNSLEHFETQSFLDMRWYEVFMQGWEEGIDVYLRDITKRKQIERELILANAELSKAIRLKDEFLANMSHELRTPLTSILGMTEVLIESVTGVLTDKQLYYLQTIERSGKHLFSLINDILDISKIEAGKIALNIQLVDIGSLCKTCIRFIKQNANIKGIEIELSLKNRTNTLYADKVRLRQILINLLSNAVKYTEENKKIGIEVTDNLDNAITVFKVWDDGIGIDPNDFDKLFKPFSQIDSSLSRKYSGTGLGLVLAYRLTKLHGGSIHVESELGKGSSFTINIPWKTIPKLDKQELIHDIPQKKSEISHSSCTILLVDDNRDSICFVLDYLQDKKYKVQYAINGYQAIEIATSSKPPDVILMDIQMPEIDGLETIKIIRRHNKLTPIIAFTALAMPGDKEKCLEAGANDYLSKPFKLKDLIGIIERYTAKS